MAPTLRYRGGRLTFERTRVMGVVNVTPDSFSDGGQFADAEAAVAHALRLVEEGADVLDLGAESSRPGAAPVDAGTEWERLSPVLSGILGKVDVPVSVDTAKPEVAAKALAAGADVVNDITGFGDGKMRQLVAHEGAGGILMHMQGEPRTMQEDPAYDDVVRDIHRFFEERLIACEADGIPRDHVIVDPGIGFGKTLEHNLAILRHLDAFADLGVPVLVGTSRKSFLGKLVGGEATERLEGSLASAVLAVAHGAHMVRVHDVAAHVKALQVADAILRA